MASAPGMVSNPIEAATIRKLRIRLLPFLFVLYVIAFLDRVNIGFAALTMNRELAITSQQFGFVAGIFFFGYFLFEVPSNLLLHRIGARIWIARILISWGTIALCTGFVHTVYQLYVARFLLGVAEAGFFPGIVLYFTYWFRQRDLAHSISLLTAGMAVANIVGAPISGLILDHIHWWHVSSWRWLLILEGLPAVFGGLLTYLVLPSRPSEAQFLTDQEKRWIGTELEREELQKREVVQLSAFHGLRNRRVWHLASTGFAHAVGSYPVFFWLPQLMK
jgi:ACS family tartrate transporter-like MFS transporter